MKFRRKTGKGKGMQGERAGKFSSWRAQARYQVSAALAARQGLHHGSHQRQLGAQRQLPSQSQSQFPRQLRGNATPGVSRQMYEMRAFEKFQQSLKRARVPPRSPDSAKDSAELSFLRHRIREERRRRASHVPPLLMLCAQKIAASLADLGEEELEWLSFFPVNVKEELLREASFLSLGKICDSAGPGVVGDRLVRELIDPAMETLMLSCSDVTDDFVQLIEPRLVHEQEEVEEEEEEEEDGEGDEGQRKDVEDGDKGREPGSASWEISALRTLESVSIRGLSQLRKLDISFCEQLTEDVMEPLGQACPGLQWLSLAGNFNRGDASYYLLLSMANPDMFRSLRFLDLSCCNWVSFEVMIQARFLGTDGRFALEALEVIRAEHCAEVAKVAACNILPLIDHGTGHGSGGQGGDGGGGDGVGDGVGGGGSNDDGEDDDDDDDSETPPVLHTLRKLCVVHRAEEADATLSRGLLRDLVLRPRGGASARRHQVRVKTGRAIGQ